MFEIDPNYGTYATVRWGYNTPVVEIREPGESGITLTRAAARRLLYVLPLLLNILDEELSSV